MNKRYQVFISSTYTDLKEERQHVTQTLMKMDCIPAGMELFPAADEEQWAFIKKVIDDCDYYLLIIGGRYGSTTDDGISYTEKEFDYAVDRGLKVLALIHGAPDNIPFGKSETDPNLREKLLSFRAKVTTGRLVRFWELASELPGLVALNLTKAIKSHPAVGWVRANQIANEEILSEINQLRKENAVLKQSLKELESEFRPSIEDIADMDSEFTIHGSYFGDSGYSRQMEFEFQSTLSWKDLFVLIAPHLVEYSNDKDIQRLLAVNLLKRERLSGIDIIIDEQDFQTITIQLKAYGLITTSYSRGTALFWKLTKKGEQMMIENRIVRKQS